MSRLATLRHHAVLLGRAVLAARCIMLTYGLGILIGMGLWSLFSGSLQPLWLYAMGCLGLWIGDIGNHFDDLRGRPRRWTTGLWLALPLILLFALVTMLFGLPLW